MANAPTRWLEALGRWSWVAWQEAKRRRRRLLPSAEKTSHTAPTDVVFARRPRVLVASPCSLYPMNHGGAVRIGNLIRRLSATHDLYLLIFIGGTDDVEQHRHLLPFCRRVFFQQQIAPVCDDGRLPAGAAGFLAPSIRDRLRALVRAYDIDLVQLEYTELAGLAEAPLGVPVVLTEHDLSFRSHQRRRQLGFAQRYPQQESAADSSFDEWTRRYRYELAACHRVAQIHLMSEDDAAYLATYLRDGARRLRVIANGVDTEHYHPPRGGGARRDLLFVGSFPHLPNRDAVESFVAEIWPEARRRLGEVRLTIAGARPPQEILELDSRDGLSVVGEVDDLRPLYASHRVMIVPLRAGSGTRLKILEAFAAGLPVISTTLGAEGLDVESDEHLLIADSPTAWIDGLERLLADDALCRRLAENGRRLVVELYDWDRMVAQLRAAHHELLRGLAVDSETVSTDADPSEAPPDISLIVVIDGVGDNLLAALAAVAEQRIGRSFEVVCVDRGVPEKELGPLLALSAVRLVRSCRLGDRADALNAGCRQARGQVFVFLDQDAFPGSVEWLELMTAPLFAPRAPSAIQGGIDERFSSRSWRHTTAFTAESRSWRRAHQEMFSTAAAAVRRDVWEAFPFVGEVVSDQRWQQQIVASDQLILPILDPAVTWRRRFTLGELLRQTVREGAGWRDIGIAYTPLDMLLDLLWPRVYGGRWGWLKLFVRRVGSPSELFFPWLRPLALCWGNQTARFRSG